MARSRAKKAKLADAKQNGNGGHPSRDAKPLDAGNQMITLQNPVAEHFTAFITINAASCQRLPQHPKDEKCDARCTIMAQPDSKKGKHVIICGAGPSLKTHASEYLHGGDAEVWGCNSAAPWLYDNGYRVTHGFTVDQTPEMLEEWVSAPPLTYLLATSCHPHLLEFLVSKGRETCLFHNYVGINKPPVAYDGRVMEFEYWMYAALYPSTVCAGSGLNAVTRAVDVAHYMGFETITVLGADCALQVNKPLPPGVQVGSPEHQRWLQEDVVMHADGGHALRSGATGMTLSGTIDGREWTTKPDMMVTAVFLVKMKEKLKDRLILVGDTLPNALVGKDQDFLDRLPSLTGPDGKPIRFGCEHLETSDPPPAA